MSKYHRKCKSKDGDGVTQASTQFPNRFIHTRVYSTMTAEAGQLSLAMSRNTVTSYDHPLPQISVNEDPTISAPEADETSEKASQV